MQFNEYEYNDKCNPHEILPTGLSRAVAHHSCSLGEGGLRPWIEHFCSIGALISKYIYRAHAEMSVSKKKGGSLSSMGPPFEIIKTIWVAKEHLGFRTPRGVVAPRGDPLSLDALGVANHRGLGSSYSISEFYRNIDRHQHIQYLLLELKSICTPFYVHAFRLIQT